MVCSHWIWEWGLQANLLVFFNTSSALNTGLLSAANASLQQSLTHNFVRGKETGFYLQLLPHAVPQWWAADLFYRDREKGHLMGGTYGAGGRTRERSSRQLVGHCLPGVSTSVISQPLLSLARYRRTHIQEQPTPHRFAPCLSCLCLPLQAQAQWSRSGYRNSDLMPASPVNIWQITSGAVGWMHHSRKSSQESPRLGSGLHSTPEI